MPNLKSKDKNRKSTTNVVDLPLNKKTRVPKANKSRKIASHVACAKETELSSGGTEQHITGASQTGIPCDNQSRREKLPSSNRRAEAKPRIPVVSSTGMALMPCCVERARILIKSGRAIKQFRYGIFYIKLLDRKSGKTKPIAIGVDPGSKRTGITVKSEKHTLINILINVEDTVKDKLESRRNMRIARRNRKMPCRKNKQNKINNKHFIPPSTKARWDKSLRIINILRKLYPITNYVVEDIKAITKPGKKKYNQSFSPLETGKNYFYNEIRKLGNLALYQGYDTAKMREHLGLVKTKDKLEKVFSAHNVDSWVLANSVFNKQKYPENEKVILFHPLNFFRRQLHAFQPGKNGERRNYGGTISLGHVRGTVIKHKKYGYCYLGGTSKERISVHSIVNKERLARNIKPEEIRMLYIMRWIME